MVRKSLLIFLLSCTVALMMSKAAFSAPIVSYSVNGSSGNWTLDFSVTNNLGGTNDIYFFGVELPAGYIPVTPHGIAVMPDVWTRHLSYNTSSDQGPNNTYNYVWINDDQFQVNNIFPDQTLSGFIVIDTADVAPTSVNWFAFAHQGTYGGADYFNTEVNPGFIGIAFDSPTPVPEPSAFLLFGAGLVGFGLLRKRFKS